MGSQAKMSSVFSPAETLARLVWYEKCSGHLKNQVEKLKFHSQLFSLQSRIPNHPTSAGRIELMLLSES